MRAFTRFSLASESFAMALKYGEVLLTFDGFVEPDCALLMLVYSVDGGVGAVLDTNSYAPISVRLVPVSGRVLPE